MPLAAVRHDPGRVHPVTPGNGGQACFTQPPGMQTYNQRTLIWQGGVPRDPSQMHIIPGSHAK